MLDCSKEIKMCYYWTKMAEGKMELDFYDENEIEIDSVSNICLLTRCYIRDRRAEKLMHEWDKEDYAQKSGSMSSSIALSVIMTAYAWRGKYFWIGTYQYFWEIRRILDEEQHLSTSSDSAAEEGVFDNPWTAYEGEYKSDEEVMKQMGLPVAWKHTKNQSKKQKREVIVPGSDEDADEEIENYLDEFGSELQQGWMDYWRKMGPQLVLDSWDNRDCHASGDAPDVQNTDSPVTDVCAVLDQIAGLRLVDDADDATSGGDRVAQVTSLVVPAAPERVRRGGRLGAWRRHAVEQYAFYYAWYREWTMTSQGEEVDGEERGRRRGENGVTEDATPAATTEGVGRAPGAVERNGTTVERDDDDDDEGDENPNAQVKIKKLHEMDADETGRVVNGTSRDENAESRDENAESRDSDAESRDSDVGGFDLATVGNTMGFNFSTSSSSAKGLKRKLKRTEVTYLQRKMRRRLKNLVQNNEVKTKTHIKFDSEGEPCEVETSKVLMKVKNFLEQNAGGESPAVTGLARAIPDEVRKQATGIVIQIDSPRLESADSPMDSVAPPESSAIPGDDSTKDSPDSTADQSRDDDSNMDSVRSCDDSTVGDSKLNGVAATETDMSVGMESSVVAPSNGDQSSFGADAEESFTQAVRSSAGKRKKKKKRRSRQMSRSHAALPDEIASDPLMKKYWAQRYKLFSKFDDGIRLDQESWYSVTPEKIAEHIAERCRCDVIVDAFCGVGGNSIQFAFTCEKVISIDVDPVKLEHARHNAKIYGVEDRIDFVCADFFHIAHTLRADVIFLSPPWGGPSYISSDSYGVEDMGKFGQGAFDLGREVSPNVAFFLPRNICVQDLVVMAGAGKRVEIEQNMLDNKVKTVTAYFGEDLIEWGEQDSDDLLDPHRADQGYVADLEASDPRRRRDSRPDVDADDDDDDEPYCVYEPGNSEVFG